MVKLAMCISCLKEMYQLTGDVTSRKYKHGPDKLSNDREMMIVIDC